MLGPSLHARFVTDGPRISVLVFLSLFFPSPSLNPPTLRLSIFKSLCPPQLPQSTPDVESPRKKKRILAVLMSSRRSRDSKLTQDEINELIRNLQAVIPETHRCPSGCTTRASASKVLKETCNFIKSLHREVEDLSERLSILMASTDTNSSAEAQLKTLPTAKIGGPKR
ncbi:hypothetical protein NE237_020468 [Protea cynaroides]|uniref:BHLH domain-containing protein n=1 Tax=Protea cynaroides TaxID=273540 RepID=A0A9Q0K3X4_9MAGN|nr:hypothetical protein NE237_020468 [Protea cynaroides]